MVKLSSFGVRVMLSESVGDQKAKRPVIHALVSFLQLQKASYFSGG
jgi:hypothetical protein